MLCGKTNVRMTPTFDYITSLLKTFNKITAFNNVRPMILIIKSLFYTNKINKSTSQEAYIKLLFINVFHRFVNFLN